MSLFGMMPTDLDPVVSPRRSRAHGVLVVATVLGSVLSLSSVACSDYDGAIPSDDAADVPDASSTPTDAASAPDGGPIADPRGAFDPADVPVVCGTTPCAMQLVAGDAHFCARLGDGTVRCWGANHQGQLGNANNDNQNTPQLVTGLSSIVEISAGDLHTCARGVNGSSSASEIGTTSVTTSVTV